MALFKACALPLFFLPLVSAASPLQTRAWNMLREAVASPKADTRQHAIAAVGSLGASPEPVRMLTKLLEDPDPDVRQTAAAALGQMRSRATIPALTKAMEDQDPGVAFFAVKALWEIGDLSGRDDLEEVLGKERAPAVGGVQGAVRSFKKKIRNPKEVALLGGRIAAGIAFGPFGIGFTAATEILKDNGATARAMSAQMLAQHCTVPTRKVLETRLAAESNGGVKTVIAKSLGDCGAAASIPMLEAYLPDSRDSVRLMSAASIIRLSRR